jgi:hypothetical protein
MKKIVGAGYKNLRGINLHCCSFDDVIKFYEECIEPLDLSSLTHFGFYCNKIDEKLYSLGGHCSAKLQDIKNNE